MICVMVRANTLVMQLIQEYLPVNTKDSDRHIHVDYPEKKGKELRFGHEYFHWLCAAVSCIDNLS